MMIPKKKLPQAIGYGILLFVITNALLFILSIVTQSEQPMGISWVWPIVAVLLAFCSLWFSRKFHPESVAQSFAYGVIWAISLAVLLLIVTIPNKTTTVVFGSWSAYLIFTGVAIGPLFMKPKSEKSSSPLEKEA